MLGFGYFSRSSATPTPTVGRSAPRLSVSLDTWAEQLSTTPQRTYDILGAREIHMTWQEYKDADADDERLGLPQGAEKPQLRDRIPDSFSWGNLAVINTQLDNYEAERANDPEHQGHFEMYESILLLRGKYWKLGGHEKLKPKDYGRNDRREICKRKENGILVPYLPFDHAKLYVVVEGAIDITIKEGLSGGGDVCKTLKEFFIINYSHVVGDIYHRFYRKALPPVANQTPARQAPPPRDDDDGTPKDVLRAEREAYKSRLLDTEKKQQRAELDRQESEAKLRVAEEERKTANDTNSSLAKAEADRAEAERLRAEADLVSRGADAEVKRGLLHHVNVTRDEGFEQGKRHHQQLEWAYTGAGRAPDGSNVELISDDVDSDEDEESTNLITPAKTAASRGKGKTTVSRGSAKMTGAKMMGAKMSSANKPVSHRKAPPASTTKTPARKQPASTAKTGRHRQLFVGKKVRIVKGDVFGSLLHGSVDRNSGSVSNEFTTHTKNIPIWVDDLGEVHKIHINDLKWD